MQISTFDAPALYGDHHVTEVRRLLFEMDGVLDVYASSAFRVIEINFDENKITHETLAKLLEEAGYLGDLPMPAEASTAAEAESQFRHTATYETVKKTVSFAHNVPYSGRPLWNCPGMGVLRKTDEEE